MSTDTLTSETNYSYQPITIILIVILLTFFFLGFFCLYFSRCIMQNILYTWHLHHNLDRAPTSVSTASVTAANGLDTFIIQSFPTFTYSSVKDYTKEKYGLECAICLVEFKDEDSLRLLTSCCHVFHQECIDLWFESHKTCPVCRHNLDFPIESPMKSPIVSSLDNAVNETTQNGALQDSFISIAIKDDNEEDVKRVSFKSGKVEEEKKKDIFSRSHSTGHSTYMSKEEDGRFSLRLPENVKKEIMKGHNWSRSCTTFGDYRSKSITGSKSLVEAFGGDDTKA